MGHSRSILFILVLSLFILLIISPGQLSAQISDPSKIPDLNNFKCPQITPGESAIYSFIITNRYNYSMENVTVTVELYKVANEKSASGLEYISNSPEIEGGQGYVATYNIGNFQAGENKTVECRIKTTKSTPQGAYFIRHMISFDYLGGHYVMKSKGYFSKEAWANATKDGSINITYLGVDGILPDSAIGVKEPVPMWPLYLMFTIAFVLGVFSVVLYRMEEEGKYPGLKRRIYRLFGKYYETEYELAHSFGKRAKHKIINRDKEF